MENELVKRFVRWLDDATAEEIAAARKKAEDALKLLSTREAKSQVKFALRLMDQEILARLQAEMLRRQA